MLPPLDKAVVAAAEQAGVSGSDLQRTDDAQPLDRGGLWRLFIGHQGRPIHKWTHYFPAYQRHFARFVGRNPLMIEIGCGEGGSLQMWKAYFGPGARIVGIDMRPECRSFEEKQITVRIGDRSDRGFIARILAEFGTPDIVLDVGSPTMADVNTTFDYLYEDTSPFGVYMVEGLHTAYWPSSGGGLASDANFVARTAGMVHGLNEIYTNGRMEATSFTRATTSIHFYGGLVAFERQPKSRREALEIGGPGAKARNTTESILDIGRRDLPAVDSSVPTTSDHAAETIDTTIPRDEGLHIHLAAMAPRFLEVRTHLPLRELAKAPGVVTSTSIKNVELPRLPLHRRKIVIVQRLMVNAVRPWRDALVNMLSKGWLVVAETDDHPDLIRMVHGEPPHDDAWTAVSLVHAVQTSTPRLAEAIRSYNPHVTIFENCAFAVAPTIKQPNPDGRLRVFYGALNRERFSAKIGAGLASFAADRPDVEFVVVHDTAFFAALGPARKSFSKALAYRDYLDLMQSCDIVLMPLEGSTGEDYKSDIKFVEASSLGLASIVSPIVYGESVVDGTTGLIAETIEAWPEALRRLCDDTSLRLDIARAAHANVASHRMFAPQMSRRLKWYEDLWQDRHALTADLNQRLKKFR